MIESDNFVKEDLEKVRLKLLNINTWVQKGYNVSTQTVLDRLGLDGLNILGYDEDFGVKKTASFEDKVLTLDIVFERYYSARIAGGAAKRTLEDYQKHMKWFKGFLVEYLSGFETALPNSDIIRA